jgi:hypothetical protein
MGGHAPDDLIILDNLSVLVSVEGKSENDDASWRPMQEWLLKLRRKGHAVLILHHTGKPDKETGMVTQRGTSKREDILTASILISRGLRSSGPVKWEFTKYRSARGDDANPTTIELNEYCWFEEAADLSEKSDAERNAVIEAHLAGKSFSTIGKELNMSKSTAHKIFAEWEGEKAVTLGTPPTSRKQ